MLSIGESLADCKLHIHVEEQIMIFNIYFSKLKKNTDLEFSRRNTFLICLEKLWTVNVWNKAIFTVKFLWNNFLVLLCPNLIAHFDESCASSYPHHSAILKENIQIMQNKCIDFYFTLQKRTWTPEKELSSFSLCELEN